MLAAGESLGPYKIVGALGAGGMGEVYRAHDTRLGRDVAVKILPPAFAADPESLKRFEQEARAAGALNHPNLLTLHDVGVDQGTTYLVNELLEGETLRKRLESGPVPVKRAIEYGVQIARGLAAAHAGGIVHRDLKPENLFVTRDGRVKILDFGIARLTRSLSEESDSTLTLTEAGVMLGTVGYIAPEQVRGLRADHRADLFAFGCVLYEMLGGRRAFSGPTAVETLGAILNSEPEPLANLRPETPPALERIAAHCLEKDPEARFQSARDVEFALESLGTLATGTGIQAGPPLTSRGKLAAALLNGRAALTVLLVIAAFAGGTRMVGRPTPPLFQRLTFERGTVDAARFSPDGRTIVYSAAWEGRPTELFAARVESPGSRALGFGHASLLSVSAAGELALSLRPQAVALNVHPGTLASASLAGGGAREVLEDVEWADWSPDGSRLAVVRAVGPKRRLELRPGGMLYETTGSISHPRFSPDGQRLAFLDHPLFEDTRGGVALVDLKGKISRLSDGWEALVGLAWAADSREIWFTGARKGASHELHAVDMRGRTRLVLSLPGQLTLQDIDRSGRVLLSFDTFRSESRGCGPDDSGERDLSWLDDTHPTYLSLDGRTLLVTEMGEGGGPNYSVGLREMRSPTVTRLGEGGGYALSPDGQWALVINPRSPGQLLLYPTGAGETRTLAGSGIEACRFVRWFDGGRRIAFTANQPGREPRVFLQDVDGGSARGLTPEGTGPMLAVSRDGKFVLSGVPGDSGAAVYPVNGGKPIPVPGVRHGESLLNFSEDGGSVFVMNWLVIPSPIYRIEITTGRRTLWKTLAPPDPAGVPAIYIPLLTRDGRSYVYSYGRWLSTLYIVKGLH